MRLVVAAALAVELFFPARARAEQTWAEQHHEVVGGVAFVSIVSDLVFSTYAFHGQKPGTYMASAEIGICAAQVVGGTFIVATDPLNLSTTKRAIIAGTLAWPAGLTAYGVWALVTRGPQEPPPQRAAPRMRVAPTVLSDGFDLAGGIGISGSW